jgi:hypothetical protein
LVGGNSPRVGSHMVGQQQMFNFKDTNNPKIFCGKEKNTYFCKRD